jgi:hypothetical protein
MKKEYALGEVIIDSIEEFLIEGFEGWCVNTNKGVIYLTISDSKQCCEYFGYAIECQDQGDFNFYKGASIVRIEQDARPYDDFQGDEYSRGGYTNLNIVTNKGVIDFWVYNLHNGFHEHVVKIKVLDEELEESL